MFKTKEELKVDLKDPCSDWDRDGGFNVGISEAFKSFAERVEFYKKYQDDEFFLRDENPEIYDLWIEYIEAGHTHKNNPIRQQYDYNHWLFDYCFGDIE